ncbi:MAG: hypothetical protein FD165_624 [Gammaproteobacteria bacterium]|nr:MAG: hypothetical protein FD165_624 [Gammaproteobacteria bacterium]TND02113.1 MAG: hypothetical protein FD120_2277 [Gammaproteobacteria bacterium]
MALEFDVTAAAPTLAEITVEREQAENERAILKKKNKRFLVYFVLTVASLVSTALLGILPAIDKPESSQDLVFVVTYFTPYLILPLFVFGNHLHIKKIEKPRKKLDAVIVGLTEATPEELVDVADGHHEIDRYRQQVAAQQRVLVKAEIDAIQRWIGKQTQAA